VTARASAIAARSIGNGAAAVRIASAKPTISSTVLALHPQSNEQRGDLCVSTFTAQDLGHHFTRFGAGQRLILVRQAMQGVDDHRTCRIVRHASSQARRAKEAFRRSDSDGRESTPRSSHEIPEAARELRSLFEQFAVISIREHRPG
jgi:hypothetical protein